MYPLSQNPRQIITELWSKLKDWEANYEEILQHFTYLSSNISDIFTHILNFIEDDLLKTWEEDFNRHRKKQYFDNKQKRFLEHLIRFCINEKAQLKKRILNNLFSLTIVIEEKYQDFIRILILEYVELQSESKNEFNTVLDNLNSLLLKNGHNYFIFNNRKRLVIKNEIIKSFNKDNEITKLLLNFLLLKCHEIEEDVIFILVSSIKADDLDELRKIAQNEQYDYSIVLRAKVILSYFDETFIEDFPTELSVSNTSYAHAYYNKVDLSTTLKLNKGLTWINDYNVENAIYQALRNSDENFSKFFKDNYGKHEESLTERLLMFLESEFNSLNRFLQTWKRQHKRAINYINFSYRDTQRQENVWNADIAFIFECLVNNEIKKSHAILIQCKKLNHNGNNFQSSWTIDVGQCNDLIKISPYSCYFLFGPNQLPPSNTLVIPANNIKGIIRASVKDSTKENLLCSASAREGKKVKKNVSFNSVRPIARNLADFVLHDFIGCWYGDEFPNIVNYASGQSIEDGLPVRHLVKISISEG
ncbi:hypothetical protein FDUTEX481_04130 [Tolypothrix sp. PCC 7601]|nr:hypothetical protein FDUTEX481_04130 [Tolypothrix sp. PCC 7601]BAY95647.1 hypothetical protein NIES3275_77240 [Microchaete diplosiphon NIES-3275]